MGGEPFLSTIQKPFRVSLPIFEGPLDLLVFLVRKEELSASDISIVRLADAFEHYMATWKELSLKKAGDFLWMAARLMQLKSSKMLSQDEVLDENADFDLSSSLEELIGELIAHQHFIELSQKLATSIELNHQRFDFPGQKEESFKPKGFQPLSPQTLWKAFVTLLDKPQSSEPAPPPLPRVQWSLEGQMDFLKALFTLPSEEKSEKEFDKLFVHTSSKGERIMTFLALLELVRQQVFSLYQETPLMPLFIYAQGK